MPRLKKRSTERHAYKGSDSPLAIHPSALSKTWEMGIEDGFEETECCALLSIRGPLDHHDSWWFDSYDAILDRFKFALNNETVKAIVLSIDSPGGDCSGLFDTVRKMRELAAESKKPVVTFANDEAYSAAYALATVGSKIIVPKSGGVGSVGVLTALCDRTAQNEKLGLKVQVLRSGDRKAEGHPDIPISDTTIANVQSVVDKLAEDFFALVEEARPVTRNELFKLQGATLMGHEAVEAGLADSVGTLDDAIAIAMNSIDSSLLPDISGKSEGAKTMSLKEQIAKARATLSAATNDEERKKARVALDTLLSESKKAEEAEEEECEDDQEDDDAEASSAEDEEEEDEEASEDKAAASNDLEAFLMSVTGAKNIAGARGAIQAMADAHAGNAKLAQKVAKMERDLKRAKVEKMVKGALRSGKLKPSQEAWAIETGLKSFATLKGYLDTATAMPTSPTEPSRPVDMGNGMSGALTSDEEKMAKVFGVDPKTYLENKARIGSATRTFSSSSKVQ